MGPCAAGSLLPRTARRHACCRQFRGVLTAHFSVVFRLAQPAIRHDRARRAGGRLYREFGASAHLHRAPLLRDLVPSPGVARNLLHRAGAPQVRRRPPSPEVGRRRQGYCPHRVALCQREGDAWIATGQAHQDRADNRTGPGRRGAQAARRHRVQGRIDPSRADLIGDTVPHEPDESASLPAKIAPGTLLDCKSDQNGDNITAEVRRPRWSHDDAIRCGR